MRISEIASIVATIVLAHTCASRAWAAEGQVVPTILKTETFDRDPGWDGVNNRTARTSEPRQVRQDFGFAAGARHGHDGAPGEMGGFVSPDGDAAFYGKQLMPLSLERPLTASGTLWMGSGGTNLLLGFFNSGTVAEWRTPNTIAIRLNGRGDHFFAYVEYCTSRWRAGGDTTPFPSTTDEKTGRQTLIGFPCQQRLDWTLTYDPRGNEGRGVVTATIGEATAICNLDAGHRADGATFDRFGIINVIKSADSGSEGWFDDITVNDQPRETFAKDPNWDGRRNRHAGSARIVRPHFDFGYSDTNLAGGKRAGELGGLTFRGDCRDPLRMACYGDRVGSLSLNQPLRASGKVALTRGITDSTTLVGFYNSRDSMRVNDSQNDARPEAVLGFQIEGPSSDGFHFYPVVRPKGRGGAAGDVRNSPIIYPNGHSHDWVLDYNPAGASGRGQITVTLDGKSTTLDLAPDDKEPATVFDRFGIVTTWIDGNSQDVYFDDISYTAARE